MTTAVAPAPLSATRLRPRADLRLSGGDVLTFVVPLLLAFKITVVGTLYLSELVLALALPFLLLRSRSHAVSLPVTPLVLMFLWLWMQIVTDVYRMTPVEDLSRGWMKILLTIANFTALYLLVAGNVRRIWFLFIGIALGLLLEHAYAPGFYGDPWKFGFAMPVTLGVALVASTRYVRSVPLLPSGLFAGAALLHITHDYRSMAGICGMCALFASMHQATRGRISVKRVPVFRVVALLAIGFIASSAFASAYARLARSGALGEASARKYEVQTADGVSIVEGGRPEVFVGMHAVRDSPLIGYGSWAKDAKYYGELVERLAARGTVPSPSERDLIPTHSHILGAWVEAGVVGTLFWTWTLAVASQVLLRLSRANLAYTSLFAFIAFLVAWDVLFSPYGGDRRFLLPAYLVALVVARDGWREPAHST